MAHAHLRLYFGLCDSRGLREGILKPGEDSERYAKAMDFVIQAIDNHRADNPFSREVHIRGESLVDDEEQVKRIIINAGARIKGAEPYIRLFKCMHGKIDFWRMLKFSGWEESQRDELIERIKESMPPEIKVWYNPQGWKDREPMDVGKNNWDRYQTENAVWAEFLRFNVDI